MNRQEAREIAEAHNWGGEIGEYMWHEAEQTYLSSKLTKTQFVWLYWMKTGYYEQLAFAVKKYDEAVENMESHLRVTKGCDRNRCECLADALCERAGELRRCEELVLEVCARNEIA